MHIHVYVLNLYIYIHVCMPMSTAVYVHMHICMCVCICACMHDIFLLQTCTSIRHMGSWVSFKSWPSRYNHACLYTCIGTEYTCPCPGIHIYIPYSTVIKTVLVYAKGIYLIHASTNEAFVIEPM